MLLCLSIFHDPSNLLKGRRGREEKRRGEKERGRETIQPLYLNNKVFRTLISTPPGHPSPWKLILFQEGPKGHSLFSKQQVLLALTGEGKPVSVTSLLSQRS